MNTTEDNVVKVGSRKSQLALIQTRYVISLLEQLYPDKVFEIVRMSTLGDRVLDVSLPKIGEKSLFTRDLEDALRSGAVHLVVHSLKDLPTALPLNMAIGAVLEREDPRDALVLRPDFKGHSLATLPPGSIIGTSSLRRTAQISRSHPHLRVVDIRGNLNTRLHKLDHHYKQQNIETSDNCNSTDSNPDSSNSSSGNGTNGDSSNGIQATKSGLEIPNYVGLILAQAGLVRMGWEQRISQVLPSEEVLYAVGQGALAIECMADNGPVLRMLAALNHPETYCRVLAERSFLKTLGGGCSAPVAVATTYQDGHNYSESSQKLEITGAVWSLNGETKIEESLEESLDLSSPLIKPSGCPYEVKSKVAKHKLTENECAVKELEASEAKRFKSTYEGSCTRNVEEIESKKVGCCRMKAMSSAMSHAEPVDIENLINIHGKLFKYCPFSETGERVCPVEYPSINMSGECHGEDLSDALVKMHPRRLSYDIKKCPFMSNQVVAINSQMDSNSLKDTTEAIPKYNLGSEPNAKNCPFLKLEGVNVGSKLEVDASWSSAAKLYCGLIRHAEIGEEALERCEELGRRLADKLIGRGALEVMHCAQNFIRSSLPDNFTLAK